MTRVMNNLFVKVRSNLMIGIPLTKPCVADPKFMLSVLSGPKPGHSLLHAFAPLNFFYFGRFSLVLLASLRHFKAKV